MNNRNESKGEDASIFKVITEARFTLIKSIKKKMSVYSTRRLKGKQRSTKNLMLANF